MARKPTQAEIATATLLVDVGNSNIKWAWLGAPSQSGGNAAHWQEDARQVLTRHWAGFAAPGRVVIASVAGQPLDSVIAAWIKEYWNLDPEFVVSPPRGLGVGNGYDVPEQLGVDRWLTLVAVHNDCPGSTCIVDCGTAITIDLIDAGGQHEGGVILPGLDMMRESLLSRTRIPRIRSVNSHALLARDTASAVASGALHAAAALVERVVAEAGSEGTTPRVVLTGSDAGLVAGVLKIESTVEPGLVMRGLALVAMEGAR